MHYYQWGNGPATLLCFHGIGQDGRTFSPFGASLSTRFTIYSFDLFYHGQTGGLYGATYQVGERVMPTDWAAILTAFLREKNIDRFSVTGFSMGGVFALATAGQFASRLDELWLLAPDGISTSQWYSFATGSAFGRRLFRFFLDRLPLFRRFSDALVQLGLLDKTLVRFAQSTLATAEQRERVYRSWISFRPLRPHLPALAQVLNQHPIQVRLFLGEYDRVLPPDAVRQLPRLVSKTEVQTLPVGHNRLVEAVANWV